MLYIPPAYRDDDLARLHAQIHAIGFATLITVGEAGPLVSHLPMLIEANAGPRGRLMGHVARANPQWKLTDFAKPAVAIFMGPDTYVSPSWYPAKQEHGKVVPTWNYRVVHVRGTLAPFDDPDELRRHVTAMTDRHEGRFEVPWKVTDAPEDYVRSQLKGIVGLRLTIETIEGKAKLSQNRAEPDRRGVIAALKTSAAAADQDIAALMEQRERR